MSAPADRAKTVPAPLPTGAVIGGKYRLDQVIAEGGMGIVYRGWHLVLDHPVAVKIVRPELAARTDAVARFLSEARAVARLRGEHVARVLDSGCIKNGPPYMVLEYLEGCDLRSLLDTTGPLPIARAIDLLLQICEAIAEVHSQGIVHRDVKPENLFLTDQPGGGECIKLLDFGISKRLDADAARSFTMQGQSLGSPHYMAPEQMSSPAQVDTRADIWSLGVVAFEMLSGEVPFDGETVPTVCAQVLCRTPRLLSHVRPDAPRPLEAVIARCLSKKPSQRYANVKELAEALAPFGSPAGLRSVVRVRRIFGEVVDDDKASLPAKRVEDQTPTPRLHSTTETDFRLPRRPLWPGAALLVAAAALVLGVSHLETVRRNAQNAASTHSVQARELKQLAVDRLAEPTPPAPLQNPLAEELGSGPAPASAPKAALHSAKPAALPGLPAGKKPVTRPVRPRWKPARAEGHANPVRPEPSEPSPPVAPSAPSPSPLRGLAALQAPLFVEPVGTTAAPDAGVVREVATDAGFHFEPEDTAPAVAGPE